MESVPLLRPCFALLLICFPFLLLLLSPASVAADSHRQRLCYSWRFNVEVNNLRGWTQVPDSCERYVASYITGRGYADDSLAAAQSAYQYASSYNLSADGSSKHAWVFDIDETSLSNIPYYKRHEFGAEAYNDTAFEAWVEEGRQPVLPATLELFNNLTKLGFEIFFVTGRDEDKRNVTVENLTNVGYSGWTDLFLRQAEDKGVAAVIYKSGRRKAIEDLGYVIVGNIGDQWSDLSGTSVGSRVFKLPNPMYYIS